jgi:hypothetical protein
MSITIVRFNSMPVCQLAPNFVSPMLLVDTDSSGSAARSPRLFYRPPPCAALPPFSHAFSPTQFAFPQFLAPPRPARKWRRVRRRTFESAPKKIAAIEGVRILGMRAALVQPTCSDKIVTRRKFRAFRGLPSLPSFEHKAALRKKNALVVVQLANAGKAPSELRRFQLVHKV